MLFFLFNSIWHLLFCFCIRLIIRFFIMLQKIFSRRLNFLWNIKSKISSSYIRLFFRLICDCWACFIWSLMPGFAADQWYLLLALSASFCLGSFTFQKVRFKRFSNFILYRCFFVSSNWQLVFNQVILKLFLFFGILVLFGGNEMNFVGVIRDAIQSFMFKGTLLIIVTIVLNRLDIRNMLIMLDFFVRVHVQIFIFEIGVIL